MHISVGKRTVGQNYKNFKNTHKLTVSFSMDALWTENVNTRPFRIVSKFVYRISASDRWSGPVRTVRLPTLFLMHLSKNAKIKIDQTLKILFNQYIINIID